MIVRNAAARTGAGAPTAQRALTAAKAADLSKARTLIKLGEPTLVAGTQDDERVRGGCLTVALTRPIMLIGPWHLDPTRGAYLRCRAR